MFDFIRLTCLSAMRCAPVLGVSQPSPWRFAGRALVVFFWVLFFGGTPASTPASAQVLVSGAGTVFVNGEYIFEGVSNSKNLYEEATCTG